MQTRTFLAATIMLNLLAAEPLEGAVDRKNQRTAWTVVDQKWPVFDAGIYNLTEQTAPVLVRFADGQTQQRLLVRVNQPQGGADAQSEPTLSINN